MTCEPLERLRWHVTSRTGKDPYLVDIGSYRRHGVCNGRCTCPEFEIYLKGIVNQLRLAELGGHVGVLHIKIGHRTYMFGEMDKKFLFVPDDRTRCAHIIFARAHAYNMILDRVVTEVSTKFNDYKGDEEWQ